MPTIAGAALAGSALDTAGNIFGMIQQDKRNAKQFEQQKQLMDIQMQNQMKLNEMGSKSQLKMWKDTNYTAQIEELKKAGLNPSLIYGMKGGGGVTTGSQGGGSAASGSAPQAAPFINIADKLNLARLMQEINVMKADANLKNTEADKLKGVDTTKTGAEIENLNQNTAYMAVKTDIEEINKANRQYQLDAEISNTLQTAKEKLLSNGITEAAYKELIHEAQQAGIAKQTEISEREANIKLKDAERNLINTKVYEIYQQLALKGRELDQKDIDLAIRTFEAEIKAEYPSLWNVAGQIVNKSLNKYMSIYHKITGTTEQRDTVPK